MKASAKSRHLLAEVAFTYWIDRQPLGLVLLFSGNARGIADIGHWCRLTRAAHYYHISLIVVVAAVVGGGGGFFR